MTAMRPIWSLSDDLKESKILTKSETLTGEGIWKELLYEKVLNSEFHH